jgi:nucleotide-binding universal stress UspA family protein
MLAPAVRPFRSVLVAVKSPEVAPLALERALLLPLDESAVLHVLHVVEPGAARAGAGVTLSERVRGATMRLRAAGRRGPVLVPKVVEGRPEEEIALHARLVAAGVVVVARATARAPGRTVDDLVARGGVPLLVVASEARGPYRSPVVAVDLELGSVEVLLTAARVAATASEPIRVVHAYPVGLEAGRDFRDPCRNGWLQRFQEAADARLAEFGAEVAHFGTPLRAAARPGRPEEVLLSEAAAAGADLVAVGTHAAQGLSRLFVRSVASEVVRRATCDVVVARPSHPPRAFPPRTGRRAAPDPV